MPSRSCRVFLCWVTLTTVPTKVIAENNDCVLLGRSDTADQLRDMDRTVAKANPRAFVMWIFTQPYLFLSDPDAVKALLMADYAIAPKNMLSTFWGGGGGGGV